MFVFILMIQLPPRSTRTDTLLSYTTLFRSDTFEKMLDFEKIHLKSGLIGAITTDESGDFNFPYLKFKGEKRAIIETKRSLRFCCTLLTLDFLKSYSFSRSEEHTSDLQSLMRISYAVFCLNNNTTNRTN